MQLRNNPLNNIKPSFIPAIAWFILSIILLTLPGSSFPKENWFDKIWIDKWVHIGMFAILVTLCCWAMLKKYPVGPGLRKIFIRIGLIGIAYGIGMEFVQKYFIPNRSFELGDIAADATGSVLGVVFSIRRYIKK
jgi:hypothetical protein